MNNLEKLGRIDPIGQITLDAESFGKGLMDYKKSSAYRKDLKRASRMEELNGKKIIFIKYASSIGIPDTEEMTNYIIASYPGYKPNFEFADHDDKNHVIAIEIEKDEPKIPLQDIEAIPSNFKSIGAGLYKDASPEENVWSLGKDENGNYFLSRKAEEKPIMETSKTDVFKVAKTFNINDSVTTQMGERGIIVGFDKSGNCVVQMANEEKLKIISSAFLYQEKAQQEIRDTSEGDLDKLYQEMIHKNHTPDPDQAKFYKELIADPKI
jgi:hypothetical protein